jgi:hypothetical protein
VNPKLQDRFQEYKHEGLITAVAVGGFLIIVGTIFALTPTLWQNITTFFDHITTRTIHFSNTASNIVLPSPSDPAAHNILYNALLQFDVAFGILEVIILAIRIRVGSRIRRIAETLGNAVFWLGAAFLVNSFLIPGTLTGWFDYWAALIVLVGISLVARAFVYFAKRR